MFSRVKVSLITVFIAAMAILLAKFLSVAPVVEVKSYQQGRNNTILLLSNADHGVGNVVLATASALLVEHPDLEVHFGTYQKFRGPIQKINEHAASDSSNNVIHFHLIEGQDFSAALGSDYSNLDTLIHRPGLADFDKFTRIITRALQPLGVDAYMRTHNDIIALIEKINPAVIAVEPLFGPAHDAIAATNRRHVLLSPNSLRDAFTVKQPWLGILWKYPAMASGIRFPIPFHQIPKNVYMNLRVAHRILTDPQFHDNRKQLRANGITKPYNILDVFQADTPWISTGSLDADFPLKVIPDNAIACGPIYLASAPVERQDPELASWLKQAPTILINLGSHGDYREKDAQAVLQALRVVFDTTSNQVLWKFNKRGNYTDDVFNVVSEEMAKGRLRLVSWITADPPALLESGAIVLSVHHGGSNCFHEAVATGVPQIILPMWADCYDYAICAEYLKIGVYGNSETAPEFSGGELTKAFTTVLGETLEGAQIRKNAAKLGKARQKVPGRSCAAREVAKLARLSAV